MYSGDTAEQVVRLSLEMGEATLKIAGKGAKNIAALLTAILKSEVNGTNRTKGKARLSTMLRSGEDLKVFSIRQKDLEKFTQHAKQYGVLYCVLKDKHNGNPNATIDILARAGDASKIQRIIDRYNLVSIDMDAIITDDSNRTEVEVDTPKKSKGELIVEEAMRDPLQNEKNSNENPTVAKTEKSPPSRPDLDGKETLSDKGIAQSEKKPSVKEKLDKYKVQTKQQQKEAERSTPGLGKDSKSKSKQQTVHHHQPKKKQEQKQTI